MTLPNLKKDLICKLLEEAGIKVIDHIEKTNLLNDCFSEIGRKMEAKIDKPSVTNTKFTNLLLIAKRNNPFFFKPLTTAEAILTYIQRLNVNKSADPEDIIKFKFIYFC